MRACTIIVTLSLAAGTCLAQDDSVRIGTERTASVAFRPHWGVGVRTSGLNSFPGTVTVGWIPGPGWILDLGLGGSYSRRPYSSGGGESRSGVDASFCLEHRVVAGRFLDVYVGAGPSLEYDHEYLSASVYPSGWMKTWTHNYYLSFSLRAALRRELTVWDRCLSVELGCAPLSAGAILAKTRRETYDHENLLVDSYADWRPNEYLVSGSLAARSYLGISYLF